MLVQLLSTSSDSRWSVGASSKDCAEPANHHCRWLCCFQVLRFFGYFLESVVESNIENYRVRVSMVSCRAHACCALKLSGLVACVLQHCLSPEACLGFHDVHVLGCPQKVVVLYYLADDSVQVTEPKQDNSGIPQVRHARMRQGTSTAASRPALLSCSGTANLGCRDDP